MALRGITVLGVFALHLVGAGCPRPALGQATARAGTGPDSVVLVPNPRYGAGWFRRLLLGDHHRDLWTLPVKVEVLDLDRFAGGLAPRCRGGGLQTASLQFGSEDGRQYVFRSADEDPTNALLPTALRRTFVAEVLQDQMSSRHPAAAVVVAPLLAAVGVLHAEPELRVMPDHARLGEFRHPFAGMLGTIEERPRAGFAAADQVEGTETIWALIERSSDDQVDPRAYFRARLIDLLVGDWDRHYDQWTWAAYLTDGRRFWRPIPRDHDQAFARLDGLILSAARPFVPQLQSFGPSYPSVYGLTWSARALDRRFLVVLEKQAWDSVVGAVQQRLTDAVLADAVSRMPGEMHGAYGARLLEALKQRRDRLPEAGHRFYLLLAQFADVHATDQDDSAFVERLDDSRVRVRLWRRGGGAAQEPYFARTFHRDETDEVRVYLRGGDDRALVQGSARRSLPVRIVGGTGDDYLVDSSDVGSASLTYFYDAQGHNHFARARGTEVDEREFRPPPRRDTAAPPVSGACAGQTPGPPPRDLGDPFKDWGSRWLPAPWVGVQPNVGLLIGGGAVQYGYGFRKVPFAWRTSITGAFATGPRRFRVWFEGDYRNLPRRMWGSLGVRYSGIDIVRFHGFGNETRLLASPDFYNVTQRQLSATASLTALSQHVRGTAGPFFGYTETELGQPNLIDSLQPYGSGHFGEVGLHGRLEIDTRDRRWAPRRGVHAVLGARLVPAALDVQSAYGSLHGEVATYLTPPAPSAPTLALRAGGKKVWGTAPFHAAAFVGGATTVRGYNEQRFAGEAALYGNAELRVFVGRFSFLLPAEFGVLGLGDVGRVFRDGEASRRWHSAGGAGLWIAFVERGSTVTLLVARSPERWSYYAGLGFMF